MKPTAQERWGFTPNPDCNNCCGDGYFAEDDYDDHGAEAEPCVFCMEDWEKPQEGTRP